MSWLGGALACKLTLPWRSEGQNCEYLAKKWYRIPSWRWRGQAKILYTSPPLVFPDHTLSQPGEEVATVNGQEGKLNGKLIFHQLAYFNQSYEKM